MPRLSRAPELLKDHYEVVVIGSGYGGAIAASRLARAKRQVCVLERGREYQPGEYPNTPFDGLREMQYNTPDGYIGSRLGLFDLHLNEEINALVGCGLGGTSLINANVALRPDPRVWKDAAWPKELRDDLEGRLEEGYKHAVDMLRPVPLPVDFPRLPKLDALQKSADGLGLSNRFSRPPINVTFTDGVNHVGVEQKRCVGCGDCSSGCNYAAKNTTLMNYLPDAVEHGAEIYTGVSVRAILKRADKWIIDYQPVAVGREGFDGPEMFITAEIVILAAGTLGSTELLLRSKARGLPLSDRLGEHFTGNGDVLAFGYNTGMLVNGIGFGNKPPGTIAPVGPCITGLIDHRDTPDVRDGFVIEEGSIPGALGAMLPAVFQAASATIGKRVGTGVIARVEEGAREAESLLRGPYHGAIAHTQTYLVMAHDDGVGKMSLEHDRLRISWPNVGSERIFTTVNDALADATRALEDGIQVPNPIWSEAIGKKLITVHPLGGCAMAESAEAGVVNHAGKVFASTMGTEVHEGLFVADGSVMPTSLGVNPLLTISAIAERTCMLLAQEKNWSIDYAFSSGKEPLETPPIGIHFTETMRGSFARDGAAQAPMTMTVTIVAEDLNALLKGSSHPATIMGTVTCDTLSGSPLSVTDGRFALFVNDPQHVDTRLMTYDMLLRTTDDQQYRFQGVKTITASPIDNAWEQTTTLAVTVRAGSDERAAPIGTGLLKIKPVDFLRQLATMEVTNAPNAATRLKALERFGKFFAGVMWDSYGGVFARETVFDPDAPPRQKRPLRVDAPEVHKVRTTDGIDLRLTRYKGGDKGPVVLLHGAGVSSRIFSTDLIDTNLLEYLFAAGYDCWLADYRVSIDLPSAANPSNADQVARFDHPALVAHVLASTGANDVQVVAHCYGATTFTMALLAGISGVRSVVISQISAHVLGPGGSEIKAGLHLPDVLKTMGVNDLTAYSDTHADWEQRLMDDALRLYPIEHDEECHNAVCHRISFFYGLLYDHKNLSQYFHDNLHELFGVCNIDTFEHLARMIRAGHVVAADGSDAYLPHLDRMNVPIAFIHGADNQCYLPKSTELTYDALRKTNGEALYTRTVIDGYGHIDCIFGRNAVVDVYPHILAHLEKSATRQPAVSGLTDSDNPRGPE